MLDEILGDGAALSERGECARIYQRTRQSVGRSDGKRGLLAFPAPAAAASARDFFRTSTALLLRPIPGLVEGEWAFFTRQDLRGANQEMTRFLTETLGHRLPALLRAEQIPQRALQAAVRAASARIQAQLAKAPDPHQRLAVAAAYLDRALLYPNGSDLDAAQAQLRAAARQPSDRVRPLWAAAQSVRQKL